jgi:predicted aspartyl protease
MRKLHIQYFWKSSLKASFVSFLLIALSSCQLWEMTRYQWHNADAEPVWQQGQSYIALPFKKVNEHILVTVRVNTGAPLTFVLDSGAAATVITETTATNKLKLPKNNSLTISGSGNGDDPVAFVVHDVRIDVGDFSIKDMSIIYVPAESMPFDTYDETYFDGVLGADFFNCCLVEINHDQQTLYLSKTGTEKERQYDENKWQKLALKVEGNAPYLITHINDGEGRKQVKVLLDTGSTGTLGLFVGNDDFAVPERNYTARTTGISGDAKNHVGLLKELDFGEHKFNNFPTYFRVEGSKPENGSHGVLGNQIMQRFNLVFDFTNQVVWVQRNGKYPSTIDVDRSGLRLLPHTLGGIAKDIKIGTAAADLNIPKNSIITHIDEQRLTLDNFDTLTKLLRAKARQHVSICWQEEFEHCETLTLKSRL